MFLDDRVSDIACSRRHFTIKKISGKIYRSEVVNIFILEDNFYNRLELKMLGQKILVDNKIEIGILRFMENLNSF